jgi:hypothetical protein
LGGGGVGLGGGGLAGVEIEPAGGADELPDGEGEREQDGSPDDDEDGGSPLAGEARPEVKELVAVADADPDGDGVADEPANGEGPHELFARHVDGAGGKDEGRKRHRWGEKRGQRDGEDGVVFHPVGDAAEDVFGDVFFKEGHAAGLTDGVGKEASNGGAEGGDGDEEEGVGVSGGEDDEEYVGDAGDGEGDEGAVDCGDGEQADDAEVAEEVDEAVVRCVMGGSGGGLDGEERGRCCEGYAHAVDYDVSGLRRVSGNFFSPARTAGVLLVAEEEISGRQ